MLQDRSFIKSNHYQMERLIKLTADLSDADLLQPMDAGWTVASVLGHLAFWDRRALTLIDKWKTAGIGESPLDVDVVNEVTRYFFLSIPPREIVRLTVEYGESIDRVLKELDPAILERMRVESHAVEIDRGKHRKLHLDEIEKALESKK